MEQISFPKIFLWSTATSAYQIEGAWEKNGKGESTWNRFTHLPYRILGGESGDVACDHYHRMVKDVALLKELDVQPYRFSISRSRVIPNGSGETNQKGLDF